MIKIIKKVSKNEQNAKSKYCQVFVLLYLHFSTTYSRKIIIKSLIVNHL